MPNRSPQDLASLSTFRKVAETRSFTAAARALRMTLPGVSRQISKLERELGVQLIARTTRALRLTGAGELLYEHCARGLGELEQALELVANLQGQPHGVLRIIATPCFGRLHIAPAIVDFLAGHPRLSVDLSLSHAEASFLGNDADILIRTIPIAGASIGRQRIAPIRHVICATPSYVALHGRPRSPLDLARHNCFVMTRPVPSDGWPVSRGAKRQIVSVSGNFRADTMEALYQAVMSGRGIARLPTYVVGPDLRSGALVALFSVADRAGGPAAEPGIWMTGYYLKSRYPDLKTLAFIDFLKMRFDARYDWERRDERWLAGAQGGD